MKNTLILSFIFFSINLFGQETIKKFDLNNYTYKVIEANSIENPAKKVYEIQQTLNDSIISKVLIDKSYKTDNEELITDFKMNDNVFVFIKKLVSSKTIYGIDRVFINSSGRVFTGIENGSFSVTPPNENDYAAQSEGGLTKLRSFIANNIDAAELLSYTDSENIRIIIEVYIDENGNILLQNIKGNDNPIIKTAIEKVIKKIPKWIPAKENNKNIVSKFSIPINILY